MKLIVESDGDRVPKDIYLVDDEGRRVATVETGAFASQSAAFKFARSVASRFNNPGRIVYRKAQPEQTVYEDGDVFHPPCPRCGNRSSDCGCD